MRTLKDLGALVAVDTAKRYFDKRANILNPMALGLGLQLPQIGQDVKQRYLDTQRQLALGAMMPIGERIATVKQAATSAGTASQRFADLLWGAAEKGVGSLAADGIKGSVSGGWNMFAHRNDDKARDTILAELKKTDPIITQASDKAIKDAFGTMVRFAPTLSTDKNAVRSYLREAVMSGAGPNYSTIKSLADAENAVNGKGK